MMDWPWVLVLIVIASYIVVQMVRDYKDHR